MARKSKSKHDPQSNPPAAEAAVIPEIPAEQQMGCLSLVARMAWLVFGNLILIACALYLTQDPGVSIMDGVYFAVAAGLIVVRYLDVTRFDGRTADGDPATVADWRRYALTLTAVAGAGWGLAHLASGFLA